MFAKWNKNARFNLLSVTVISVVHGILDESYFSFCKMNKSAGIFCKSELASHVNMLLLVLSLCKLIGFVTGLYGVLNHWQEKIQQP